MTPTFGRERRSSFSSPSVWLDWSIFQKLTAINFHSKVAQIVGDFLGYFGKWHYLSKNCRGLVTFWATIGRIGLLLIPTSGRTALGLKWFIRSTTSILDEIYETSQEDDGARRRKPRFQWQEGTFNARKRFGSGDDVVEIFCELYANCLTDHLLPTSNSLSTIAERTRSKAVWPDGYIIFQTLALNKK